MTQATLGYLAPNAECRELCARGAPQVVQRERWQSVLHALHSGVQRIEHGEGDGMPRAKLYRSSYRIAEIGIEGSRRI